MSNKSSRKSSRRTTRSLNDNRDQNGFDSSSNSEQQSTQNPDEWEVESVLSKQIKRDGSVYYLLKWKNYKGEPTWEPENNCGCDKLINDFHAEVHARQDEAARMSVGSHGDSSTSSNSKGKHTKSVSRNAEPTHSSFAKSKTTPKRRI